MATNIDPLAGKPAPTSALADIPKLLAAYFDLKPDPSVPEQRVAFGTSGHRGSSLTRSFNEWHILATTQAICDYRTANRIEGPLFIGADTHALSKPALDSALEVLAANGVETLVSKGGEFTPTPAISHAILSYNRERRSGLADGIVVTPSHNPPEDGGFKYNPTNGGPADTDATGWIQKRANALLEQRLHDVRRMPIEKARSAATTHEHDYLDAYVADLGNVIDFDVIRNADIRLGVDPLGGAGVHYWRPIAERYSIPLEVVSEAVDPQFAFMTLDWDGKIRMDPSSPYAMQRLVGLKDRYDVAFACDTDHDRHGVVTRTAGLMQANHYLSAMVAYLYRQRAEWGGKAGVGKTIVTTSLIDRIAAKLDRRLYEVPVGFKWFSAGLMDGSLGFGCEESAGASFLRRNGQVWTTDKDGIVAALVSAEMMARGGKNPSELYRDLTSELGEPFAQRIDAPATSEQKSRLSKLSAAQITRHEIAGEKIDSVIDRAPGNSAPIGGIKVIAKSGWFAARPSGTEDIYKIYAESFQNKEHLNALLAEAQQVVDSAIG